MQNNTQRLYTVSEILRALNISRHRLVYLFDSRKLKREEFQLLPNGHIVFTAADLERVKTALFEVSQK